MKIVKGIICTADLKRDPDTFIQAMMSLLSSMLRSQDIDVEITYKREVHSKSNPDALQAELTVVEGLGLSNKEVKVDKLDLESK